MFRFLQYSSTTKLNIFWKGANSLKEATTTKENAMCKSIYYHVEDSINIADLTFKDHTKTQRMNLQPIWQHRCPSYMAWNRLSNKAESNASIRIISPDSVLIVCWFTVQGFEWVRHIRYCWRFGQGSIEGIAYTPCLIRMWHIWKICLQRKTYVIERLLKTTNWSDLIIEALQKFGNDPTMDNSIEKNRRVC